MDAGDRDHDEDLGGLPSEASGGLDPQAIDDTSHPLGERESAPTGWFDRLLGLMGGVAGVIVLFVMFSVSAEVLMRQFFGRPLGWTTEVSEVGLLYLTFFAAAWVLRKEAHIKVELVGHLLSKRGRAVLGIVTSVVGALACAVLTVYGTQVALGLFERGARSPTLLRLPEGPIVAVIPLGSLFLAIEFVRRALRFLRSFRRG